VVTGEAASQLRLDSGGEVQLGSGSAARIYSDHAILEQGTGEVANVDRYRLEALGLAITAQEEGSAARVRVSEDVVEVAALRGGLRVSNNDGILLAAVAPGRALSLMAAADGASAPSRLTGCVREQGNHYLLTDDTAGVTVELTGSDLSNEVGHQVSITGVVVHSATPVDEASQVVQINILRTVSTRCSSSEAAAAAGGASATGTAEAGAGDGTTTTAVIAGVVVAAAGTGAAIGLTRGSDEPETISR